MASYCYSTYIADGYCLNFADSHGNRLVQQPNVMYVIGVMTGDVTMQEFAAYVAREKGFWSDASGMYDKSGNYPTLGRELVFQSMLDKFSKMKPRATKATNLFGTQKRNVRGDEGRPQRREPQP